MFGALNRFISRLDADPQAQEVAKRSAHGFQVLKNINSQLAIEPWFDFIIGINGRNIDNPDPNMFATEVRNCTGNNVNLGLWSAKGQRVREVYTPVPADVPSLGLSLQWTPVSTTDDVWHILEVTPNSPADHAGLLPYGDYIIGSPEGLVRGEAGLGELVEDYLTRPLRLHVYNQEYNVTREITIQPSRNWGGSGALGCVLGFGALHRIPPPLDEPPQAPGETLFDTAPTGSDGPHDVSAPNTPQLLVPAETPLMVPPSSVQGASGGPQQARRANRPHHHTHKTADIDAFFAEGEAKSREQDHSPSPKKEGGSGLAPPPKAGGAPPKVGSPLKETSSAGEEEEEEEEDA